MIDPRVTPERRGRRALGPSTDPACCSRKDPVAQDILDAVELAPELKPDTVPAMGLSERQEQSGRHPLIGIDHESTVPSVTSMGKRIVLRRLGASEPNFINSGPIPPLRGKPGLGLACRAPPSRRHKEKAPGRLYDPVEKKFEHPHPVHAVVTYRAFLTRRRSRAASTSRYPRARGETHVCRRTIPSSRLRCGARLSGQSPARRSQG